MNDREKELVEMVLDGKTDAFEPLVSPYRQSLLNLAYRMTQNWEDSKEIAQEALLRVFRFLGRYDTRRSFKTWVFQILANEARDFYRKGKGEKAFLEKIESAGPDLRRSGRDAWSYQADVQRTGGQADPEQSFLRKEFGSELEGYLARLPFRERRVFVLRDIEGLNIRETANVLGCSSISVRVNLSSARRKIRDLMVKKYPDLAKEPL
jgi:RNA polymerase sigma-70 factor (ECF subfamily)